MKRAFNCFVVFPELGTAWSEPPGFTRPLNQQVSFVGASRLQGVPSVPPTTPVQGKSSNVHEGAGNLVDAMGMEDDVASIKIKNPIRPSQVLLESGSVFNGPDGRPRHLW